MRCRTQRKVNPKCEKNRMKKQTSRDLNSAVSCSYPQRRGKAALHNFSSCLRNTLCYKKTCVDPLSLWLASLKTNCWRSCFMCCFCYVALGVSCLLLVSFCIWPVSSQWLRFRISFCHGRCCLTIHETSLAVPISQGLNARRALVLIICVLVCVW